MLELSQLQLRKDAHETPVKIVQPTLRTTSLEGEKDQVSSQQDSMEDLRALANLSKTRVPIEEFAPNKIS